MAESTLAYVPLVVLAVVAFLLVLVTLLGNKFMGPQRANVAKMTNYECGEQATPGARGPIDIQYYMFILTFLVFDVEAMFLIPFALNFRELSTSAIVATVFFVSLILIGYVWELRKKLLTWRSLQ